MPTNKYGSFYINKTNILSEKVEQPILFKKLTVDSVCIYIRISILIPNKIFILYRCSNFILKLHIKTLGTWVRIFKIENPDWVYKVIIMSWGRVEIYGVQNACNLREIVYIISLQ